MKIFEHKFSEGLLTFLRDDILDGNLGFTDTVAMFESEFSSLNRLKYNIAMSSNSGGFYSIFNYYKKNYGVCDVFFPSLTFNSPVWAAIENGHNVKFVDISSETLCVDMSSYNIISSAFPNNNKKIIVPTLYGGVSFIPGLDDTEDDCVIDAAQSLLVNHITTIVHSFHSSKPIMMADGGIVSTNDSMLSDFLFRFRNFGRSEQSPNPANGFKFYMNNLNAKMGLYQMKDLESQIIKRCNNFHTIIDNINIHPEGYFIPHDSHSTYYFGTYVTTDKQTALRIKKRFKELNIQVATHYPLLHNSPYYVDKTNALQKLKVTEDLIDRIINFPIHHNLSNLDLEKVIEGLEHE